MPIVEVGPYVFEFDPRAAVLVIIDMQRDEGCAAHRASYSTRSLGTQSVKN